MMIRALNIQRLHLWKSYDATVERLKTKQEGNMGKKSRAAIEMERLVAEMERDMAVWKEEQEGYMVAINDLTAKITTTEMLIQRLRPGASPVHVDALKGVMQEMSE